MKTEEDILALLRSKEPGATLDAYVLLRHLSWEVAKPFLTPAEISAVWVPEAQWPKMGLTSEEVIADLEWAMDAAWERVEGHRGVSASMSLPTIASFLWLLEDAEVIAAFEAAPYPKYGAPKLAVVAKAYGFEIPEFENVQAMIKGFAVSEWRDVGVIE